MDVNEDGQRFPEKARKVSGLKMLQTCKFNCIVCTKFPSSIYTKFFENHFIKNFYEHVLLSFRKHRYPMV